MAQNPLVTAARVDIERRVTAGEVSPTLAAKMLIEVMGRTFLPGPEA
jgi:hypothetical protein